MKFNISKLIGSIIVFCLAVGGVFGYALYGAGKKSVEMQQAADQFDVGKTSAGVESINGGTTNQNTGNVSQSDQNSTSVASRHEEDGDDEDEGDDDDNKSSARRPVSTPAQTPTTTPISNPNTTPVDTRKTAVYKNGTYTAVGSYKSPAGTEQIKISVTLQNDVITNTSAVSMANDRTSEKYMQKFIGGYAAQIVGKNIDTIQLDFVSGSSLTPNGFNDALSKIKVSAKA